jgi:hypothetical protein
MSEHPEAFTIVKGLVGVLTEIEEELLGILQQESLDAVGNAPTRQALTQLCARVRHYRGTVTRYIEDTP